METDVERLQKMNRTVGRIPEDIRKKHGMTLKPIELLEINPSESIDDIAGRHVMELPKILRLFLGDSGNTQRNGSGLLSYLLFSKWFCKDLIALGYKDGLARREEIEGFFSDHMTQHNENEKSA
jgi:NTE family protein